MGNQTCNEHKTNLKSNFNFKLDDKYNFYDKTFSFKFWNFLHRLTAFCFLKPYIFIKHCVKVKGKENIKEIKNKGAVVISNHIDVLDIQMISLFLFGMRKYNWLTLERNFCLSVHWLLKNSGAIPVPTDSKYKSKFFQQINDLLKNKELLHICPEAALQEGCKDIREFKIGAFMFSYDSNVPVLPVTILQSKTKNGKIKYTLNIDKPQYPNLTQPREEEAERLRNTCHKIMQKNCESYYNSND